MLLAHLSDLHLGHRAYERVEAGRNVREADVAGAFQRAVQEVIRLKPDLILLVGDIFDRPDPPPGALVALARGLEAFRSAIPSTQIFMVAGARDTPRATRADPGALAALDPFPQVEAVTGTARSVFLKELDTHLYLVPHGAVVRRPFPQLRTHPDARWNLLLAYAGHGTGPGPGLALDLAPWDYVALGYLHQHQQIGPRAFYPGSLERVGPEPWREAAQEKGFLTFDLEAGRSRFHPIPGRAVVALAPIRFPRGEPAALAARVREVMGEVPGGIDGKIVRLRIEGLSPEEVRREGEGLFAPLREKALHLAIEVDDFQRVGEDNPLPLASRDRGFSLRVLRERLREGGGEGEEALSQLAEIMGGGIKRGTPQGREEELVIRELHGTALPYLGDVTMEGREGLLGWMGGDGRILSAFTRILMKGVGLAPDFPPSSRGESPGREPGMAIRLGGIREGSFWMRTGPESGKGPFVGADDPPEWSLPGAGVALAWCGTGGESPEALLEKGGRLLSSVRGVEELESLQEELLARYPVLSRSLGLKELSPQDYERLRLESELSDLRAQLRALQDVPEQVSVLELEMKELRLNAAELTGDLEAGTMDWHRERQDAETHLHAYRDRAREVRVRIRALETLGPESPCPTCGRVLEGTAAKVLQGLREEWEALVQDGQWWRRRWEQLEAKPDNLQELERHSHFLNSRFESCTERLERARSGLRELDELRVREGEVLLKLQGLQGSDAGGAPPVPDPAGRTVPGGVEDQEPPSAVRFLLDAARALAEEVGRECRTRLLHQGGRRLNRLTGGRILGLECEGTGSEVTLVEGGTSAGMEADQDRAAAIVALRMALVETLAEEWCALGSFILGDPFDRMGEEDQLRGLALLRRILSRVPQVFLLTRGSVVERAPEFFDGLFEFREEPARGLAPLRALPAGVGVLRVR